MILFLHCNFPKGFVLIMVLLVASVLMFALTKNANSFINAPTPTQNLLNNGTPSPSKSLLLHHLKPNASHKSLEPQTPAEDRLFFPPYHFPFWGLPYGIWSKGGFFNPGLFPFVPGGPGFPPYDGIFGGPEGPGKFPGPGPTPFQSSVNDSIAAGSGLVPSFVRIPFDDPDTDYYDDEDYGGSDTAYDYEYSESPMLPDYDKNDKYEQDGQDLELSPNSNGGSSGGVAKSRTKRMPRQYPPPRPKCPCKRKPNCKCRMRRRRTTTTPAPSPYEYEDPYYEPEPHNYPKYMKKPKPQLQRPKKKYRLKPRPMPVHEEVDEYEYEHTTEKPPPPPKYKYKYRLTTTTPAPVHYYEEHEMEDPEPPTPAPYMYNHYAPPPYYHAAPPVMMAHPYYRGLPMPPLEYYQPTTTVATTTTTPSPPTSAPAPPPCYVYSGPILVPVPCPSMNSGYVYSHVTPSPSTTPAPAPAPVYVYTPPPITTTTTTTTTTPAPATTPEPMTTYRPAPPVIYTPQIHNSPPNIIIMPIQGHPATNYPTQDHYQQKFSNSYAPSPYSYSQSQSQSYSSPYGYNTGQSPPMSPYYNPEPPTGQQMQDQWKPVDYSQYKYDYTNNSSSLVRTYPFYQSQHSEDMIASASAPTPITIVTSNSSNDGYWSSGWKPSPSHSPITRRSADQKMHTGGHSTHYNGGTHLSGPMHIYLGSHARIFLANAMHIAGKNQTEPGAGESEGEFTFGSSSTDANGEHQNSAPDGPDSPQSSASPPAQMEAPSSSAHPMPEPDVTPALTLPSSTVELAPDDTGKESGNLTRASRSSEYGRGMNIQDMLQLQGPQTGGDGWKPSSSGTVSVDTLIAEESVRTSKYYSREPINVKNAHQYKM